MKILSDTIDNAELIPRLTLALSGKTTSTCMHAAYIFFIRTNLIRLTFGMKLPKNLEKNTNKTKLRKMFHCFNCTLLRSIVGYRAIISLHRIVSLRMLCGISGTKFTKYM